VRAILRVAAPLLQNSTPRIALFSCRSAATLDGMRWIASRANCARGIHTLSMRRIASHRLFRTQGESPGARGRPASRRIIPDSTSLSCVTEKSPLSTSSSIRRRHRASGNAHASERRPWSPRRREALPIAPFRPVMPRHHADLTDAGLAAEE
jgi:hypothetical protein